MRFFEKVKQLISTTYDAVVSLTHSDISPVALWNKAVPRIIVTAFRGYQDDACGEKAAALTYYSLLSVVPALAVAFGIAEGFGLASRLAEGITAALRDYPDVAKKVIDIIYNYLDQAKGGVIAGIGVIILLYTAVLLLRRIEETLNAIWKTERHRPTLRMITDYSAVIIFFPLLFAISSSISIYLVSFIKKAAAEAPIIEKFSLFTPLFWYLLPLCISWFLFTLLYLLMPNTRVSFIHAFIGGITAGTLYQMIQWGYIHSQVTISHYGAIYGTLAALPLFILWVNISWNVALFGGEIAYHAGRDEEESFVRQAQTGQRIKTTMAHVAMYLVYYCIQRFEEHKAPLTPRMFSETLGISYRRTSSLFRLLESSGVLARVIHEGHEEEYIPALPLKDITLNAVLEAFATDARSAISVNQCDELDTLENKFKSFLKDVEALPSNTVLRTISKA